MTLEETTRYLREHIPLTVHLGAVVERYDGASLRLAAPLAPNLNHRSTAFGGSLSAIAILSGWTLVHLALRERGVEARVVIQRSEVGFDEPVDGDFLATSTLPPAPEWDRFLETLRRHRRARVTVRGAIETSSRRGGTFENVYVAVRDEPPEERARR
ncbi:thioesterase domain-containing protein [Anaeromyxobacter terrae]|uniref:thioesterase domain-containing protein n=1 Tax=Anaeromyxobacter terrae TaxID=2925406 RepID=UPI001F565B47|nr:thioesterase domain-containing protein [Anaeromyxobacter sp. SG22]